MNDREKAIYVLAMFHAFDVYEASMPPDGLAKAAITAGKVFEEGEGLE